MCDKDRAIHRGYEQCHRAVRSGSFIFEYIPDKYKTPEICN